ncbi:MAG: restriction endonuclease subunit S [Anaerolineales bacterium]|nr:restriction endonuclease subunit S [Anaerolineales bacterium]
MTENLPTGFARCKLGDLITLKRGYDLPHRDRKEGEFPIVSSSGITGYHNEAKVEGPGVVTGRYGTLGEVFFVQGEFWPLNTALYVQDFKGNDPRFISYFLQTIGLGTKNTAGAVPGVNRNVLHRLQVIAPDLPKQKEIVKVLSAYDDLIDNNNRRIALLEEAIHRLYREWFVHLRFPGHENTPVVAGVPEGWEKRPLEKVGFLNYGKSLPKRNREDGDVPVYGSSGIVGTHNKALIPGPSIIVGRKGNVGSVFWSDQSSFPIDTVFYIAPEESSIFLYLNLQNQNFINTDAAVPGLNRNYAHKLPVLVPTERLLAQFEEMATPIHKQITTLQNYNAKLAEARDALLPRLMNGSLAV